MAKTDPEHLPLPAGLGPGDVRLVCDPDSLGFDATDKVKPKDQLLGQDRAVDAIKLAAGIGHKDFNIYVLGNQGTGRHAAVTSLLRDAANARPVPCDWVYVNNFEAPHKPGAMQLPAGMAGPFRKAMQDLVDDLANEVPALFDSEEYQTQRRAIEEEFGQRHEEPIAAFADRVKEEDVALLKTPMGFMLVALVDGKPVKPDVYEALPPAERADIDAKIERLQEHLSDVLRHGPQLEKEHRQRLEALHASMAERVVSLRVADVADMLPDNAGIAAYLVQVRDDMISNAELFLLRNENDGDGPFPEAIRKYHREPHFARYAVNIMVSCDKDECAAPVIHEDMPSLNHLTGRIEHISEMGTLATNFTLIKPGALHRANGGYLVLDAHRLLSEPFAWDALKRCLQAQSVTITSLADQLNLTSTTTLEPDPIPLDVRVVLIGNRRLHMLLTLLDPEFGELFKLQADFEDDLPRSARNTRRMVQLVASFAARENLRPLTASAVAAILDHAVRLADDSKKFTLRISGLADVMREADHYAGQAKHKHISDSDITQAINEATRRASRVKDRLQEAVIRKTILINTSGTAIGQVNGLSVLGIGGHAFGRPSRITARVRMGTGKLVDIEREVELGGPLHTKGVLILGAYLAAHYATDVPISLHASLVFEQSYGGIDGDSASSAELYALLSALSGVPIRQGIAVTGSVNQNGEVQAIGGVNEKIEGFFDICKARKLTGEQGVLIPMSNVDHLMLRPDVVAAAKAGTFRVIPVKSINEGIEVLTGRRAGKRSRAGQFTENSINALVEARLRAFAEARRRYGDRNMSPTDTKPDT
ncbi:Lon protease family protein [uncultured Tateyamaria sp.]|uniref:Lon protease family protein n=1 Tax=uncultured Tateyamaria sp. TaxID=455651 RepID=UPI00262774EF|nr:AAA family ATPase [uncultured Tateyamaria sp.]